MDGNLDEPQLMMNGQWPNGLMSSEIISVADDLKQLQILMDMVLVAPQIGDGLS